jgi:hypothetical protein
MAMVSEREIDELLREGLSEHGVLGQLENLDLFTTPEGVLVEVVLRDALALEQAQRAVQDAERQLGHERVFLLPTVRALWEVSNVRKIDTASPSGVPAEVLGALFKGSLKSGELVQEVWVAMTPSALRVLRPLAANDEALANLVRDFLRHRLSVGGPGYWNPIRDSRLELDAKDAQYLRWRPYQQLKASVDRAFRSHEDARRFLGYFSRSGTKASGNFNGVLGELARPGGAIARGEQVPTSNYQLYELMLDTEKKELEAYYSQKLERACKDWPELKQEFPEVLPK